MGKLVLGITRYSLLNEIALTVGNQEKRLKDYGCNAIIHDSRARLPINTKPDDRLDELGVWAAIASSDEGAKIVTVDASRLIRSYLEFPILISCIIAHETQLIFLSEDFSSTNNIDFVKYTERMTRLEYVTKQESLKAGHHVYAKKNPEKICPVAKTLILKNEVAQDLRAKKDVVNTALKHNVSGSWIYGTGLHLLVIQKYLRSLNKWELKADSRARHIYIREMYLGEMKKRALEKTLKWRIKNK